MDGIRLLKKATSPLNCFLMKEHKPHTKSRLFPHYLQEKIVAFTLQRLSSLPEYMRWPDSSAKHTVLTSDCKRKYKSDFNASNYKIGQEIHKER